MGGPGSCSRGANALGRARRPEWNDGGRSGEAEHPRPDDGRPDGRVAARDVERQLAAGSSGRDVHEQLCVVPALLPVADDLRHRPVRAQPHDHGQRPTGGRLRQVRAAAGERAPGVAPAGRLHDGASRQVLERVRRRAAARGSPRLVGVVRVDRSLDLPVLQLHAERERTARDLRDGRGELPGRRLQPEGCRARQAPRAERQAVLPLGRVPRAAQRRAARPRRPGRTRRRRHRRRGTGTRSPTSPCRRRRR